MDGEDGKGGGGREEACREEVYGGTCLEGKSGVRKPALNLVVVVDLQRKLGGSSASGRSWGEVNIFRHKQR